MKLVVLFETNKQQHILYCHAVQDYRHCHSLYLAFIEDDLLVRLKLKREHFAKATEVEFFIKKTLSHALADFQDPEASICGERIYGLQKLQPMIFIINLNKTLVSLPYETSPQQRYPFQFNSNYFNLFGMTRKNK